MLCEKPYSNGYALFGCGQCVPCRVNRRRVWTHRLILESLLHGDSAFVTLTYDDETLPRTPDGVPTLRKKDVSDFLKRLRTTVAPLRLRFYACGEYGPETLRPHYHLALFGWSGCLHGATDHKRLRDSGRCCVPCETLQRAWGKGRIDNGRLERQSAAYLAGYVLKKLTWRDDLQAAGLAPEFSLMSNRPGIGAGAIEEIKNTMTLHDLDGIDVPTALRHGKSMLPLGRYMRRKLRLALGKDETAPPEALAYQQEQMHALRKAALDHAKTQKEVRSLRQQYIEENKQAVLNVKTKTKIFSRKDSI